MQFLNDDLLLFIYNSFLDSRFIYFTFYAISLSGFIYILFSIPYFVMDLLNWSVFQNYKIKKDRILDYFSIKKSVRLFILNWIVQIVAAIILWPLVSLSYIHKNEIPVWWIAILQLIGCFLVDDSLFFIFHRILHRPWFYKRIHAIHHEIKEPYALAAGHFHVLEYLILSLSSLIGPILIGVHLYVFYIWIIIRQWIAVEGHSGYMFPFTLQVFIPFHDGNSFHDIHHRNKNYNFGLYLNWLDRLSGTWKKN